MDFRAFKELFLYVIAVILVHGVADWVMLYIVYVVVVAVVLLIYPNRQSQLFSVISFC